LNRPPVLSRRELDVQKCGTPGCGCSGPLIMMARCHPNRPIDVAYDWTTGLLTCRCSKCELVICRIAVAAVAPVLDAAPPVPVA
jgi:hypothetical protein